MNESLLPRRQHKDAESLGLYDYLSQLEAEREKCRVNPFLYPGVVVQAIIGEILNMKNMIKVFERAEWQDDIDSQLQHNHELERVSGL